MSFQALHAAWMTQVGDASAQLVMFALAGHHNDETGLCCPSQATLARRTGLSVDTVGRAVKRLEGMVDGKQTGVRYITRHVRRDPVTGERFSDAYTLHFASPRQLALLLVQQADEEERQGQPGNLRGGQLALLASQGATPQGADKGGGGAMRPPSPHGADETRNQIGKGSSGAKTPGATTAQVEAIWALIPTQRATKEQPDLPDVRKRSESKGVVAAALSARLRDGDDFDRIKRGVAAYYADPDITKEGPRGPYQYAQGAQRVLRKGLWETYVEAAEEQDDGDDLFAPSTRQPDGTVAPSAPVDLVADWQGAVWLQEWLANPASWRGERGPQPGHQGCRISPDLQRANGVTPWGDQPGP